MNQSEPEQPGILLSRYEHASQKKKIAYTISLVDIAQGDLVQHDQTLLVYTLFFSRFDQHAHPVKKEFTSSSRRDDASSVMYRDS